MIKTKCVWDSMAKQDGLRILTTRYRGRGLPGNRYDIWIANLRYRDSVEDRVHQVLADRLASIHDLFGQIPDTLEDVWVQVAMDNERAAKQLIDQSAEAKNPFDTKYSKVEDADWETCATVLDSTRTKELLSQGW